MLSAVDFYGKIVTVNIEIHNVASDILLAVDGEGETLQKKIPKLSFLFRHAVSKVLGVGNELLVVIERHICYSPGMKLRFDGTEQHFIG